MSTAGTGTREVLRLASVLPSDMGIDLHRAVSLPTFDLGGEFQRERLSLARLDAER